MGLGRGRKERDDKDAAQAKSGINIDDVFFNSMKAMKKNSLSKPEPSSGRSLGHVTSFSRPFNLRGEFARTRRAEPMLDAPMYATVAVFIHNVSAPPSAPATAGSRRRRRSRRSTAACGPYALAAPPPRRPPGCEAPAPALEKEEAGANICPKLRDLRKPPGT